jgi:hypothetical protein
MCDVMKTEIARQLFIKLLYFMKVHSALLELFHAFRQTDEWIEQTLILF